MILKPISDFFSVFIDFLFPPYCIFCQATLERAQEFACDHCWASIPTIAPDLDYVDEIKKNQKGLTYLSHVNAAWAYTDDVQIIIHQLKYNYHKSLAKKIAAAMKTVLNRFQHFQTIDLFIPVPLHKIRLIKRGYNQSQLICAALSQYTNIPMNDKLLARVRNTRSQTKLDMRQRIKNVNGAFQLKNNAAFVGKNILLIDDVITTGATINACAEQLKLGGAREVYAMGAAKA